MLIIDGLLTWDLSQAAALSHRVLHRRLGEAGFTGYEYRILSALADGTSLTQTELGRQAALDRSDVTVSIRRLIARGLVDRQLDPTHGRRMIIIATPAGLTARATAEKVMTEIQDELFGTLTERDRNKLRTLLRRIAPTPE